MTHFMQHGDNFIPGGGSSPVLDQLPPGNYQIQESMAGLFFQRVPDFTLPAKLYGNITDRSQRIMKTFLDRERATGVLLEGEKGSGKSQLARNCAVAGHKLGIPTILINAPWHGEQFNALMAAVTQPAIVIMDEFEKVYDRNVQESILTLLDGTMTSKKLFILTVNNRYAISSHMQNRPGRLFYSISFAGLDAQFVREYCEDRLEDKSHIESVVRVSTLFEAFNFDMLKALVEEMNRYGEDPFQAMELLNAKPASFGSPQGVSYSVEVKTPGGAEAKPFKHDELPLNTRGNAVGFYARFDSPPEGVELDSDQEAHIVVRTADVRKMNADQGLYEFVTQEGYKVTFTRDKPEAATDWRSLLV